MGKQLLSMMQVLEENANLDCIAEMSWLKGNGRERVLFNCATRGFAQRDQERWYHWSLLYYHADQVPGSADGSCCFTGAPEDFPDHVAGALSSAVDCLWNWEVVLESNVSLDISAGIATGLMQPRGNRPSSGNKLQNKVPQQLFWMSKRAGLSPYLAATVTCCYVLLN